MSWLRLMEERIKETGQTPEAEQTEAVPPVTAQKTNKLAGLLKEMWAAYLIEIFVIILGISITLALEEWRDGSKENRLEQIYLKNLLADIILDRQSLNYASAGTQELLNRGNELLAYSRNPGVKPISASRFNADLRAILARPDFSANDATFSDLKNSGNLHLLEDIQLKKLLFTYYNQVQNIRDNQNAEQQATITLSGAYFLKQFPMDDEEQQQPGPEPDANTDLPKSTEFRNNVLLRVSTRKELLGLYQKADSLALQLKQALGTTSGTP